MMAKIVRCNDSATEPNHPANCRFDVQSASCGASEDLPMPPAASNGPKTSEFAFFKRLKQDVGHTSCRSAQNRTSSPLRKFGPSSHGRERGNPKLVDTKSAKKSTAGEIDSFLSHNNPPLEHSGTSSKEHDCGRFNSSSLLKTPTNISLDSFLSNTANASVKPESQQNEGDVFSSKRQKLLQHTARALFPETGEVPTECNLVTLLLRRLLPECSQETLSQILPLKQPEPKEKNNSNLRSDIQLKEIMDTSMKVVNHNGDTFLHTSVSDEVLCGLTVEANAVTDDRFSNRTLFWQKYGDDYGGFPIRNLTLGNELYGFSSPNRTSPEILTYGPCMKFSYGKYDTGESNEFRDCSRSYEVLDGSYDSLTAANSGSLCKIREFGSDRRAQSSQNCWLDFSSCPSFERFQPSASDNLRDCTELNYANDFKITRELTPLLLGWDPNKSDIRESTHNGHMELEVYRPSSSISIQDHCDTMELEIYHPPLSTRNQDHWDPDKSDISDCDSSPATLMELEIYCPPSSTSNQDHWVCSELDVPPITTRDHWDNLEIGSLMPLSPNTCNGYGFRGHHLQEKSLVPKSPLVSYTISHDPEELNPVDSSLFKDTSKSNSFFTIPQGSYSSLETMMCKRTFSGSKAFISKSCQSDFQSRYKPSCGFLRGQYEMYTDDLHELFRQRGSSSQFLSDSAKNLAISHPEDGFFMSECIRVDEEDSFPLLLDTVSRRETGVETYDEDKATVTFW